MTARQAAGMASFHRRAAAGYRKVGRPDMAEQAEGMRADVVYFLEMADPANLTEMAYDEINLWWTERGTR